MSISKAAKDGDQIKMLQEMRERISDTLFAADCHARDIASLSKRMQELGRDIAALEGGEEDEAAQLQVLKDVQRIIASAADDPECLPRDLATLTRRLQDVNKDILNLEARVLEKGTDSGGNSGSNSSGDQPFDPSQI